MNKTDKQKNEQMNYSDLIGCKFKVHGRDKDGFDCFGLCIEVLKRNGIELKDVFYEDFLNNDCVKSKVFKNNVYKKIDNLKENCIIDLEIQRNEPHIAVYIGDGKMIHCTKNLGVIIEPIYRYKNKIKGYYQVSNC